MENNFPQTAASFSTIGPVLHGGLNVINYANNWPGKSNYFEIYGNIFWKCNRKYVSLFVPNFWSCVFLSLDVTISLGDVVTLHNDTISEITKRILQEVQIPLHMVCNIMLFPFRIYWTSSTNTFYFCYIERWWRNSYTFDFLHTFSKGVFQKEHISR